MSTPENPPETPQHPEADAAPAAAQTRRRPLAAWTAALALLVIVVDQATKYWAEQSLTLGEAPIPLLGDLLGLRLLYNPGAALSIATGLTWLLTIVVVVVVVVILRMIRRLGSRAWAVALGLLLGGAVGNLLDRFFREPGFARGHVVDFIDYAGFFVGNVADIAIVGAAVMIAVLAFVGIGLDGRRHGDDDAGAADGADSADSADEAGRGAAQGPAADPAAGEAPPSGTTDGRDA